MPPRSAWVRLSRDIDVHKEATGGIESYASDVPYKPSTLYLNLH